MPSKSSRTCTKCGSIKPATTEHFNRHKNGLRPECRDCQKAYGRAYKAANRDAINAKAARYREANRAALSEKQREYYGRNREALLAYHRAAALKHEYGLSSEQYMAIFDAQGGVCRLCGSGPGTKSLRVDHCHSTGLVRGLLCAACNSALGVLGDNELGLMRAMEYLRSAATRFSAAVPEGLAYSPRSKRYDAS